MTCCQTTSDWWTYEVSVFEVWLLLCKLCLFYLALQFSALPPDSQCACTMNSFTCSFTVWHLTQELLAIAAVNRFPSKPFKWFGLNKWAFIRGNDSSLWYHSPKTIKYKCKFVHQTGVLFFLLVPSASHGSTNMSQDLMKRPNHEAKSQTQIRISH